MSSGSADVVSIPERPPALGGWLLFIFVLLFSQLCSIVYNFFETDRHTFSPTVWQVYGNAESKYHAPFIPYYLAGRAIYLVFEMVCLPVILFGMCKRRTWLPKLVLYFLATRLLIVIPLYLGEGITLNLLEKFRLEISEDDRTNVTRLFAMVAFTAIGIAYFRFSKRVRRTFVTKPTK